MTKDILQSDRVVMVGWVGDVDTEDVLRLLHEISRARQRLGAPIVAILSIAEEASVTSASTRAALAGSLPRILSHCQKFLLALAPATLRQRLIRAFFLSHATSAAASSSVQLCDSLPEAIECAQRLAPQEVLELQRALLKQSTQTCSVRP